MVTCAIIEDDIHNQTLVRSYINEYKELKLVWACNSARKAIELIGKENVELLFLDIELEEGESGLVFYKDMVQRVKPYVIVMTSHLEYAVESYNEHLEGFLYKPFNYEKFKDMVGYVLKLNKMQKKVDIIDALEIERGNYIPILKGPQIIEKVPYGEIAYLEQIQNDISIYTIYGKKYDLKRTNLINLEFDLPYALFQRISKGIMINKQNAVNILDGYVDVMGKTFKISSRFSTKNKKTKY